MTDEIKKTDDKEKEIPAAPQEPEKSQEDVEANKPESTDQENGKEKALNNLDDKVLEKTEQLTQLYEEVDKVNVTLREKRGELRKIPSESDQADLSETDFEGEEVEKNKKEAVSIFAGHFPEFSPDQDIGSNKWDEFMSHYSRIRPSGNSVGAIVKDLEYVYKHIYKKEAPQKSDTESIVEDSGIGETISKPRQTNQPDILTRSLNTYEQKAAKMYPGGEQAYRQARAEREKRKV